jgi:hypothetical protein
MSWRSWQLRRSRGRSGPAPSALTLALATLAPQLPFVDAFLALPLNRRLAISRTLVISLLIAMIAIWCNDEVRSHSSRLSGDPVRSCTKRRYDGTRPTSPPPSSSGRSTIPLPLPCHGLGVSRSSGRVLCAYPEEHGRVTRLGEVVSLTREEQAKPSAAERQHVPRGASARHA